jgi:hypothetical protein
MEVKVMEIVEDDQDVNKLFCENEVIMLSDNFFVPEGEKCKQN